MGLCPKTNSYAPLIKINGQLFLYRDENGDYYQDDSFPGGETHLTVNNPGIGYVERSEQLVHSTRNALGQVVSQVINRRLNKFDNLYWPYLSWVNVHELKQYIKKFQCRISYWDSEEDEWVTRRYYWGDFEATPCEWQRVEMVGQYDASGNQLYMKKPIWYKDVKCNLIDMGYDD